MKVFFIFIFLIKRFILSKWIGKFKSSLGEEIFKINKGIYYEIILYLTPEDIKEKRTTAILTLNDYNNYILMKEKEIIIDTFKSLEYKFHIGIQCSNDLKVDTNYTVPLNLSESDISLNILYVSFKKEKNNIKLNYRNQLLNNSYDMIILNLDNDNIDKLDLIFENTNPNDIGSYVKEYYVKNNYIYYNWLYNPNIKNHKYNVKFKDNILDECFNLTNNTFEYNDLEKNVFNIRELKSKVKRNNELITISKTDINSFYILCSARSYKSSDRQSKSFFSIKTPFSINFDNLYKNEEYHYSCYVDNMGVGDYSNYISIDLNSYKNESKKKIYPQCFKIEFEEWSNVKKFTDLSIDLCDNMIKNDLFNGNYNYEKEGCLSCENIHKNEIIDLENKIVEICTYIHPQCKSEFNEEYDIVKLFDEFYNKINTTEKILQNLGIENMVIKSENKINSKIDYILNEDIISFKINEINSNFLTINSNNKGKNDIKCYFTISNRNEINLFDSFDLSKDNEKISIKEKSTPFSLYFNVQSFDNQIYKLSTLCFDKWNENIRGGPFIIKTFVHTNQTIILPDKDDTKDKYNNIHSKRHSLKIINDENFNLFSQLNLTDQEIYINSEMGKSKINNINLARILSIVNCSNYPSYDKCFELKKKRFSKINENYNSSNFSPELGFELTNNPDLFLFEEFNKIISNIDNLIKYISYDNMIFSLGIFGNLFDIIKYGIAKNFSCFKLFNKSDYIIKSDELGKINNNLIKNIINYNKYKSIYDENFRHDNFEFNLIKKDENKNETYSYKSNDIHYLITFNLDNLFKETNAENILIIFYKNESYPYFKYDTKNVSLNVIQIKLLDKNLKEILYDKELSEKSSLHLEYNTSNKDFISCYLFNISSSQFEMKTYNNSDKKCLINKIGDITIGINIQNNNKPNNSSLIAIIISIGVILLIIVLAIIIIRKHKKKYNVEYNEVLPLKQNEQ